MSPPRRPAVLLGLLLAAIVVAGAGIAGAMRAPRLVAYAVDDRARPATAPPLRIVQLSDTHASEPFMRATRLMAIVRRVNALRPDIVVLTGDYVGDRTLGAAPLDPAEAVGAFRALRPRFGAFAVLGNHDHGFDPQGLASALRRAGVRLLVNEHVDAGPITIVGIDDEVTGRADLAAALRGIGRGRTALLISHSPDIFPQIDDRVGLTLAGHTHGGQIVLPIVGPLATASRYGRRYVHGHIIERGRHLIVSAGIGTSLLPMRIGAPPEVVLVTIN